ncbi:energy-coupling factor ABC transporter ATP-binding protein [Bifidobacterium biavatii]|uniref:Cobalt ABC transporter ATPase n=1 Tax=Bifidobacterium biavatii DSM 23969 TaxID=1437608 RepID=A0A086ZN94_9BIFI|nr:ABC transporter ATP-binding protein [Bifidobacterium biavatii]KFI47994.1 cobalt ABC transporter ATPase [Bifidobacterium biavatii DSM 23969]
MNIFGGSARSMAQSTTSYGVNADWFAGEPLVALEHVDFAYRDRGDGETHPVLRDFSMTIARGECVALLGPNGSGKTTIMRIVNALEFPDSGTYRLGGTVVERRSVERRDSPFAKALHQRVGFVFQSSDTQLFCPSVEEEIAFGPMQMGLPDDEIARRVDDMVALFGLDRMRDRAPYRLSGGEKKRVAIACCLSMNPDLLVLDEPTDGLDECNTDIVVDVLRAFVAAGKTVLISTHHHDVVERLSARIQRIEPLIGEESVKSWR